jgi:hypothetical protein
MNYTRRAWLQAMAAMTMAARTGRAATSPDVEARVTRLVQAYSDQGVHRTATDVDTRSADWLAREVEDAGLAASREAFTIDRVDPVEAFVEAGGRRIAGFPLFDAAFTDAAGVSGRLGVSASGSNVALLDLTPNAAATGAVGQARRAGNYAALVCVTRGGRPGLCPSNADSFTAPFGPPVVQVSSEDGAWLAERANEGASVRVVAQAHRATASAYNVTASIAGGDRGLPPLVIMTPRSGWYTCASERGGGIVCWLELMRALRSTRLSRDVLFVASSGHELGHLGINAFVDKRPGVVARSAAWMHFGANIGAATDPGNTVQSSDDESESRLTNALAAAGLRVDRRVPRGTVPGGEAEVVHRGGGTYVSVIGRNALFHHPADKDAGVVDAAAVARFVDAFTSFAAAIL